MKKVFFVSLAIAALAMCASTSCLGTETAKNQVDSLFQQSLAADQAGNNALRDRLLADILVQDPQHKLARWHSGQVLHNGKWQSLEKIERLVANDPRWQEYRSRVETGEDSLAAQAALARWCRSQGLKLEAEWHWFNVLRHDAGNREALGGLGLRTYRGEYLTPEQIAVYEAEEKQAKRDFRHYTDLLKAAMREAERSEGTQRNAALNKISGIQNPAAIQAIVEVVLADVANEKRILSKLGTAKGEKLLREMQLAGIAALSDMPEHEATLRLLEIGLYASDAQVRTDAARSLKYREPTSYVPLLMAGLAAPIELSFTVSRLPNGQITVFEDLTEAGPLTTKKHTRSSTFLTQHINIHTQDRTLPNGRGGRGPTTRSTSISHIWSEQWRDMANATAQVANTQDRVELENAIRKERNTRIQQVMEFASGKELGEAPEAWWSDWKAYNELYTPEVLPVAETEENFDYSRQYEHYTRSSMAPATETQGRPMRLSQVSGSLVLSPMTYSCFEVGTPVWTQSGPIAIEKIRVGELVLRQDPHSGELSYRAVVNTMMTPQSPTVKLGVNEETLITTRGHRFWVAGKGWQMAKFIKTGDQLFSASGSIDLQTADKGTEAEVYNLEVDQFHTYFVGRGRVLVHDNTCPEPTINTLPGVSPRADEKPVEAPQVALRN